MLDVLMLRGPQTPGELKTRTERLHRSASMDELGATLERLIERELVAASSAGRASARSATRSCWAARTEPRRGRVPRARRPPPGGEAASRARAPTAPPPSASSASSERCRARSSSRSRSCARARRLPRIRATDVEFSARREPDRRVHVPGPETAGRTARVPAIRPSSRARASRRAWPPASSAGEALILARGGAAAELGRPRSTVALAIPAVCAHRRGAASALRGPRQAARMLEAASALGTMLVSVHAWKWGSGPRCRARCSTSGSGSTWPTSSPGARRPRSSRFMAAAYLARAARLRAVRRGGGQLAHARGHPVPGRRRCCARCATA